MLSTALEAAGLTLLTVCLTVGVWTLAGLGWALLMLGVCGGGSLLFVGAALSVTDDAARIVRTPSAPLTNEHVERG